MTEKLIAAVYGPYDGDVLIRLFRTVEEAEAWADEIAAAEYQFWYDEPAPVENPGRTYFDKHEDEWFMVQEVEAPK